MMPYWRVCIIESEKGLREIIFQGGLEIGQLLDFSGWRILGARHKTFCVNGHTHANAYSTLGVVTEHDLKPNDIAEVHVKVTPRELLHTTTAAKKYPRNAESADHSTYYVTATIIKDRDFGPEAFEPSKFTDPVILDLIEKTTVEADSSLSGYQAITEIKTKDGRCFQKHVKAVHGLNEDPLTDEELETKFRNMAIKYMSENQIKEIFDTIWNLDKLDNIEELTKLMVFPI
ncbi:hypothetical protein ACFLVJ_03765 [Chloroflexota bacterium]